MEGFQDYLKEQGVDFDSLADHEKIQILNRFLTKGLPQRSIKPGDWKKTIENVLRIQPKEHSEESAYSLDSLSTWDVVELPATVSGTTPGGYVSAYVLSHIHGFDHGVRPDFVSMGVVIARHVDGYPGSLFVNVFQDWSGFSHCFCSIELKETDDGDYTFVRGTFHPGFAGLIEEREIEFLGFLDSYFRDESIKSDGDDPLPGRWQIKRDDTRVYRPGVNKDTGRATLMDIYSKEEYQWDYVTRLVQDKQQ